MKIAVRFYGVAYENTGVREWSPCLHQGANIIDLLDETVKRFPTLRDLVFDDDNSFRDYLAVSVNNVDILGLEGTSTVLSDGDVVFIMPPIGGG